MAREITAAAGSLLGMESTASYVELVEPLFADAVQALDGPAVAVPLLLSTGYHVQVDLPRAVGAAPWPVALGGALGPDRLLARAQAERLVAAGAVAGQPVVLVGTGSADPASLIDLEGAVHELAREWEAPVRLATLGGLGPRLADVLQPGDAVSPYLLATGFFHGRLREVATSLGAGVVADVIGPHPLVVELVVKRARALLAEVTG